jgi:hypothetical protein
MPTKRKADSAGCRLCTVKHLSKRQMQIHKGICATEAKRVGWVKAISDPLYAEKMDVVEASLNFHTAYHSPEQRSSVVERQAWDQAIATLQSAQRSRRHGR